MVIAIVTPLGARPSMPREKPDIGQFKAITNVNVWKMDQSSPGLMRLCRNMKIRLFGEGERRSGEKDLERQPLTVWIQGRQPYEDIQF